MSDLVCDWYFTRCVNLAGDEPRRLVSGLQRLRLATLAPRRLVELVEQLGQADPRARAYAVPALVRLARDGASTEARHAAARVVGSIVRPGFGDGSASFLPADLLDDLAHVDEEEYEDGGTATGFVTPLETLAAAALTREVLEEQTPYFGLSTQLPQVFVLSAVLCLAEDPAQHERLRGHLQSCAGDEPDGDLSSLVLRGASGALGRLPFLLALQVVGTCVGHARMLDLVRAALEAPEPRVTSYEPDLLATVAALGRLGRNPVDALVRQPGLSELGDPAGWGLTEDVVPDRVLRRLGVASEEDALALQCTVWQATQLRIGIERGELTPEHVATLFAPRAPALALWKVPDRGETWATRASWLARASGSEVKFQFAPTKHAVGLDPLAHLVAAPWPVGAATHDGVRHASLGRLEGVVKVCVAAASSAVGLAEAPGADAGDDTGLAPEATPTRSAHWAATTSFLVYAEAALAEVTAQGGSASWDAMLQATVEVVGELTGGHVASVAPGDLLEWAGFADDAINAIPRSITDELREQMCDAVYRRPLTWAMTAAPHLDDPVGPGRWADEIHDLVRNDLDQDDVGVAAAILNDIAGRFEVRAVDRNRPAAAWRDLAQHNEVDPHAILLSESTTPGDWAEPPVGQLSPACLVALAIRRVEALGAADIDSSARAFGDFTSAMALFLHGNRPDFYVLLRAVALIGHPAVRRSGDRAEQVAALGIASDEPLVWRFVLSTLLGAGSSSEDDQASWRVLGAALRRLLALPTSTATDDRLRAVWREHLAEAVQRLTPDRSSPALDILQRALSLDEQERAVAGAQLRLTPDALARRSLRLRSGGGAGATWRARALVLDPHDDEHGAFLEPVEPAGVSSRFPPGGRPRYQLAAVVAVSDDGSTATIHVGDTSVRHVPVRGTPPRPGDLVRFAPSDEGPGAIAAFAPATSPLGVSRIVLAPDPKVSGLPGRTLVIQSRPGQERVAADPRMWDADTARAFARGAERDRRNPLAIADPDLGWTPLLRDGLALVLDIAARDGRLTMVYNQAGPDAWVFSSEPGVSFALRRADLTPGAAEALDAELAAVEDPNGLLVTFALTDDFMIDLLDGPHDTEIHGDVACPFDHRNLAWREVLERHGEAGVLVEPTDAGEWLIDVDPPAPSFPSTLLVLPRQGPRRGAPPRGRQLLALDAFDAVAQRTGRVGAQIERSVGLRGAVTDVMADLLHSTSPVEVTLEAVVGSTLAKGGWVSCVTSAGFRVFVRPEELTLAPATLAEITSMNVRGRTALLRPARGVTGRDEGTWTPLPDDLARDIAPHLPDPEQEASGLVWARPQTGATGNAVQVILDVAGHPSFLMTFATAALVGNAVRVRHAADGLEVRLDRPFRVVGVIRPVPEQRIPDEGSILVGSLGQPAGREPVDVAQTPDGSLVLVAADNERPLFTTYRAGVWEPAPSSWLEGCRVDHPTAGRGRAWTSVSKASPGAEPSLVGGSVDQRELVVGAGSLRGALISTHTVRGGVTVSRRLVVSNLERRNDPRRPTRAPRVSEAAAIPDVADVLDRLWESGEPVVVEIDQNQPRRASVIEPRQLGIPVRETVVPVLDDAPVLVSGTRYDSEGRALLVPLGDRRYGLSFRDVPDLDVDTFAAHLGAQVGVVIRLPRLLYAMTPDGDAVLEFGYGLRVSADPTRLRFDGEPFERASGVLFHGDEIGAISFTDSLDGLVMDIRSASVTASAATTIYRQASLGGKRDVRFLHLLRVEVDDEQGLVVTQVEGFRSNDALLGGRTFRGPGLARATLHVDDVAEVLENLEPGESTVLYGELDTDLFASSAGLTVTFRRRTLTKDGLSSLRHRVVTFLECGDIEHRPGEIGLNVHAASSEPTDLDRGVAVIRRNFSVDVNQLGRLARLEGDDVLDGALVVAGLTVDAKNDRIVARLAAGDVPNRATSSLRDLVRAQNGLHLLVARVFGGGSGRELSSVRLEFRFGIYFSLRADEIDEAPVDLGEGDVVRVSWSATSSRFTLLRCAPGDLRFFDSTPRPVVVLPTNPLRRAEALKSASDPSWWAKNAPFVPGGLPGEFAVPAHYDRRTQRWMRPNATDLTALMGREHPKLGLVALVEGRLRMAPGLRGVGAGHLRFSDRRAEITIDDHAPRTIDPAVLTFADTSAADLTRRAEAVTWRYHDAQTVQWIKGTGKTPHLPLHSHRDQSLVFFEHDKRGQYRLRYTTDLDRWAYSSRFLTQGISPRAGKKPKRTRRGGRAPAPTITCAVAGLSHDASGRPDGIYLEVAPGVICLVLDSLLEVELPGGRRSALDGVSAASFGVGDTVELRVVSDPARSVDAVHLVRWVPSARGVVGHPGPAGSSGRLVVPVHSVDEATGALDLGAGDLVVRIPTRKAPPSDVVALGSDNSVRPYGNLVRGDTVLLIVEDDRVAVAGFPDVEPFTTRDTWPTDVWHDHVLDAKSRSSQVKLKREIVAAGGALAVTVTQFSTERSRLRFDFSRQTQHLVGAATLIGAVVGHHGQDFMVRVGAAVVRIRADLVVAGLPPEAVPAAAAALGKRRVLVWVDQVEGTLVGRAPSGDDLSTHYAEVDAYADEIETSRSEHDGLVVREVGSQGLRWLAAADLALTRLRSNEVRRIWLADPRPPLTAASVGADGARRGVSLLAVPAITAERQNLRVGAPLGVTVRAVMRRGDDAVTLVETGGGAVLELATADVLGLEVGDQLGVEVSELDASCSDVVVVPTGRRQIDLVLPRRLLSDPPELGAERPQFASFLHDLATAHDLGQGPIPNDAAELERALAAAYGHVAGGAASARAAAIAGAWWSQVRPDDEVDLLPMLVAAYLLVAAASAPLSELKADAGTDDEDVLSDSRRAWNLYAAYLLGSLGRRGLCSLHVEVLMRHWLPQRHRHSGVGWRQLELTFGEVTGAVSTRWRTLVEPMLVQLELGAGREGRLVAAALRIALGELSSVPLVLADSDLHLPAVIATARITDPPLFAGTPADRRAGRRPPRVADLQLERLAAVIERIRANRDDVILLADPPWFI